MSKVKMPDPSLYVLFDEQGYPIEAHSDNSSAVDAALAAGGIVEIERYITTDQAEAYADARVREALEEAAALCDRFAERDMHPAECAGAIRSLVPKETT